ncbi:MAG: hypothetical protein IT416_00595 [Candidatus Pacebacteria bacterium]|nr:hypothetical protein [Candidatus Paceibacterota bacterium]
MEETTTNNKKVGLKTILRIVVVLGLMGFAGWSFFKYQQAQKAVADLSNPEVQQEAVAKEREEILAKVSKLMILPDDEEPTIATVTDAQVLAQYQPFFRKASDGDKVILYVKSGKSIIYSPDKDIIVNVGTISVQGNNATRLDTENRLKVEIRNGGASQERVDLLAQQLGAVVEVTTVGAAASQDYQGPVIVALTTDEARLEQARIFAANLGVQLTQELPVGEAPSDAEVVVIAGN